MRRRSPAAWLSGLVLAALVTAGVGTPGLAGAQEATPGLAQARDAATRAAQEYADAQAALGELATELSDLETEQAGIEDQLAAIEDQVTAIVVDQYIGAGGPDAVLPTADLNEAAKAEALVRLVTQHDTDVLDEHRALQAQLAATEEAIRTRLADQEALVDQLAATQAEMERQLAVLEEAERRRLEEERRRAEEAAREAAAAAERRAAAERAATLARQEAAREAGSAAAAAASTTSPGDAGDAGDAGDTSTVTTDVAPTPAPATPPEPVVQAPVGGGMICPVPGSAFVDSFGAPRPQGWAHQGVDMMASSGTPIVAPVSGTVTHRGNSVGGLAFHLDGSDGRYYYGAHLSAYGQSGSVSAGTVIGYVGNTGDAAATAPHLHLEIHIGGVAVNPYPYVAAVC